jgi:hypothetical protein
MVDVGREKAARAGVGKVRWMVGRAEDVDPAAGPFEVVTAGNAFHRLDRRLVAERGLTWLSPGGCLAVLGSSSLWSGTAEWQEVAREVVSEFTDRPGRAPAPPTETSAPRLTHEAVLREAGFAEVKEYQFHTSHMWTVDSFVGYLKSTSVGSNVPAAGAPETFEDTLRHRLLTYDSSGRYEETIAFYYILARRPRSL